MSEPELDAAIDRALLGWAEVTLWTSPLPATFTAPLGVQIPGMELHGVVDFTTDLCALDGPREAMRFSAHDTYQRLGDGRWTVTAHAAGSWNVLHPHGLLEGLRVARTAPVERVDDHLEVELDQEHLSRLLSPGIFPQWRTRGAVSLTGDGRLASASLLLADSQDPRVHQENRFSFEPTDARPTIELPPPSMTITAAERFDEITRDWAANGPPEHLRALMRDAERGSP